MHETLRIGNKSTGFAISGSRYKIIAKKLNVIKILKYTTNFPL